MDNTNENNVPNPTEGAQGESQQPDPKDGTQSGNNQTPPSQNQPTEPAQGNQGGQEGEGGDQGSPAQNQEGSNQAGQDDYKVKFSESTKENQRLMALLKDAGIDPKTGQPFQQNVGQEAGNEQFSQRGANIFENQQQPLTDEELQQAIPGFAFMDETEKEVIRNIKGTAKQIAEMQKIVSELYDERIFNQEVKKLLKDEKYKPIAEKLDEFTEYAYKDENRNIPLSKLAELFLIENGQAQAGQPQKQKPQRTGVEAGGQGRGEATPTDKNEYTAAEIAKMRQNDPKRYQKLVMSGKLKIKE